MSGAVLRADRAGFRVGDRWLVKDVSLSLWPGQFTVIAGPNGAGKSTLLKLLTGEGRAHEGTVQIDGEDVQSLAPWRLACKRAVMAQAAHLAFPYTVHEVASLGAAGIGRSLAARRRAALAMEALVTADVAHLAAREYPSLSGGERQRVQFARALTQLAAGSTVDHRQILFLDEPVSSLDLKHQIALLEAARAAARRGAAVLAVLHDLNLAIAYADEMLVMAEGRTAASGAPDAVVSNALLRQVFDIDLRVMMSSDGRPYVLPHLGGSA